MKFLGLRFFVINTCTWSSDFSYLLVTEKEVLTVQVVHSHLISSQASAIPQIDDRGKAGR